MSGFKRDAIDSFLAKVRDENLSNGLIPLEVIEQLSMGYSLSQHMNRLSKIIPLFRECDIDDDGIIDQEGIMMLI